MRIRQARPNDLPEIAQVEQQAAQADGRPIHSEADMQGWLLELCEEGNVFVVTDDDDELNPWGQAGTLDGISGPIAGYTALFPPTANTSSPYRLGCRGAVAPQFRRQNAGRLLLQGALNRARMLASELDLEPDPVYFEALLPTNDPASPRLAARFEMHPVEAAMIPEGTQLYR
ncbi:MAG: hypothetical protein J2P37_10740, partial [Ktedonobacteraceae bacterium]|nr:hypothetical protein [Ktedonobacteraceae bacterium]